MLITILPELLLAPLAGIVVDRLNRKFIMVFSDIVAGLTTLGLAYLAAHGQLQVGWIYAGAFLISLVQVFHFLAYSTIVTITVPREHLARASGLIQSGEAFATVLAPILAGVLIVSIQITGVILIDGATFLVAVGVLLAMRIPHPRRAENETAEEPKRWWTDVNLGWSFILRRPGLKALLVMFAITNIAFSLLRALLVPFVLTFASAAAVGMLFSLAGLGTLVGGGLLGLWGGPKDRVRGILAFWFLDGILLALCGVWPAVPAISSVVFGILFLSPIINGCSQAIWQSKTPLEVQGRVFAVRRMIAFSCTPLAYIVGGPLADKVLEPMMSKNGLLASTVGAVIGTGPGRGMALLFIVLGIGVCCTALLGFLNPRLRNVQLELKETPVVKAADLSFN
jgi:MFS family permease